MAADTGPARPEAVRPSEVLPRPAAMPLSSPYWDAIRAGRFMLQECRSCGRRQHYPRLLCRHCHRAELGWAPASTAGTVIAAALTHRTSSEALRGQVPFLVVLVRLDDGPLVLATTSEDGLRAGVRVVVDPAGTAQASRLHVVERPAQDDHYGHHAT
jgi:uncharacterized OB-fold protein